MAWPDRAQSTTSAESAELTIAFACPLAAKSHRNRRRHVAVRMVARFLASVLEATQLLPNLKASYAGRVTALAFPQCLFVSVPMQGKPIAGTGLSGRHKPNVSTGYGRTSADSAAETQLDAWGAMTRRSRAESTTCADNVMVTGARASGAMASSIQAKSETRVECATVAMPTH
jgi:hypothetical protein